MACALGALALGIYVYRRRHALLGIAAVFAFAVAFTLLLSPVCRLLERRGLRASLAAAAAVCGFLLIALLAVSAFVPYLVAHSIELIRRNAPTLTAVLQQVGAFVEQAGLHSAELRATVLCRLDEQTAAARTPSLSVNYFIFGRAYSFSL